MEFSNSQTENFEMEKISSDTGCFKKPVEINKGTAIVIFDHLETIPLSFAFFCVLKFLEFAKRSFLAKLNGSGFFSELFENCDNEQIYHFEKKVEHAKKNVSISFLIY